VTLAVVLLAVAVLATVPPATATAANATATVNGTTAANATADAPPEIVAVYPNPVADGDAGEFVIVRFPEETAVRNWSLADGESNASLPNATVSGRVAVSPDPEVARNLTDARVLALADDLALANGGETVRLVRVYATNSSATASSATVSTVTYESAPEGERWHRAESGSKTADGSDRGGDWRWTPLGATDFKVARTGPTEARAFVLPDAPEVPLETVRSADRRVLLAGYTFASPRVADALAAASRRGVEVRVLVDDAPVGGLSRRSAKLLDSLVARGVEVRVLGGPRARYAFHHAKYAVADDRALVTTENWKPAGTGGHSSRGWGTVTTQPAAVERLVAVFRADAGARDATPWAAVRDSVDGTETTPATAAFPADVDPDRLRVDGGRVLVAPDNAETAVVRALDDATESVSVIQLRVGGRSQPFVRALVRAAPGSDCS
jgi:hypothetical protein